MMRYTRIVCPVLVALCTLTSICSSTENTKRAPSGFQGVRGKKSIQDTYPDSSPHDPIHTNMASVTSDMDKRAPSAGFHGMRGKKLVFPLGFQSYPAYPGPPELMYAPKRAPMGFMGMRGKKEMELVDDELDKRAPNMGFLGMRGKKLIDEDEEAAYNDYYMDKRAPNMGFLGMRGKKEYAPLFEEDKRAPSDGFFGMRGKKQPGRSGFFGMRGKKYPYEFRGKFVGVRGKKDSSENTLPEIVDLPVQELTYPTDNLDINELMLLLSDGDGYNWEKRKGPSGFLGMRG